MTLVLSVLEQGMIYAIMALGIYITYTILDFPASTGMLPQMMFSMDVFPEPLLILSFS